jgi:hypothetical protein
MSGRWGDRPLGRGDGGYSGPKSVRFLHPAQCAWQAVCCAREQQDNAQEQNQTLLAPEAELTPDHW